MRKTSLSWLALTLLLGGCGTGGVGTTTNPAPDSRKTEETPVKIEPKITDATLSLAWNLLNQLESEKEEANLFFSPLSVSLALSMALNGAEGETYQQIAKTLSYEKIPLEEINAQSALLMQTLRSPDPKAEVSLANSLWVAEGFPIEVDFVKRLQQFYDAEAQNLDFARAPEAAAQRINEWVKAQTRELIPKLFEPDSFDASTIAVLVNALYFKGKWQKPFSKDATHEMPFRMENGRTKSVPMMMTSGKYPYYKGDGYQAVVLPYGEGNLQFYLLLPDEGRTVAQLYESMNPERWKQMAAQMKPIQGNVGLPRFRVEARYELKPVLQQLGMQAPFQPNGADFSRISREYGKKIYISQVIHKAVVQVDEEGTEAAAATGVEMELTAVPQDYFSVIADRPFLFAIVHQPTGAILFMGIMREP